MRFSATTVMTPECDLLETVQLLKETGYKGVEWRTRRISDSARGKPFSFWGNHKNDMTPERFLKEGRAIRKLCDDHGLTIVALAPSSRADQLDEVKLLADGAAEAAANGVAPFIRIAGPRNYDGSVPYPELYKEAVEAYGKALEITRARGVKIVIEIHGGTIMVSSSLAHRIVANFSPKDIGVIYDINNMTMDGFETPQMAMELLGEYMVHVHLGAHRPVQTPRDEQGTIAWKWENCPMAEGLLHVPTIFKCLDAVKYTGFITLEDYRPGPAQPKLKEAMDYFRAIGAA